MISKTFTLLAILIFACTFQAASQHSKKLSPSVKRLVHKLAKYNVYETAVSPETSKSKQIRNFEKFKVIAKDHELVELTDHENGIIRIYAFKALEQRSYGQLLDIIIKHINDTEIVKYYFRGKGFISGTKGSNQVGEYYVRCWTLAEGDRKKLDSLLIFTDNNFKYTQYLLEDWGPDPTYYNRIKELVKKDLNKGATIALSKFKNINDLQLIERRILEEADLKRSMISIDIEDAIEYFPHQYFKKTLDSLKEKGKWHYFTEAAVFKDSYAYNYLKAAIQMETRAKDIENIYKAIQKYKNPIYDSLLFKIWETDHFITDSTFSYLLTIDPAKCSQLITKSLRYDNKICNSLSSPVVSTMLDYLIKTNKDLAINIISDKLKHMKVFNYRYFAMAAKNVKHEKIIESLIFRIQNDDNGHVLVPSVETILSYQDSKLNNELVKTIRSSSNISGWALEDIKTLLKKYNLQL